MALISTVKGNTTFIFLSFKFLQLLEFILVDLRRGNSPWRFLIRLYLAPMLIKNV
jgi:hypothetical protein